MATIATIGITNAFLVLLIGLLGLLVAGYFAAKRKMKKAIVFLALGALLIGVAVFPWHSVLFNQDRPHVTITGPFYKFPDGFRETGEGYSDVDSNIHIVEVSVAKDTVPHFAVVFQGFNHSWDAREFPKVHVNDLELDWSAASRQGGVFVLTPRGKTIRTNLSISELLQAMKQSSFERGLTSVSFDRECRPLLTSLTK